MFSSPALRSLVLLLLALALATPVLVVAGSWLAGASPNWGHLSSTVLPSYLRHSLFLALFTGTGTLLIGVAAAWAVSRFRFPGRRVLEWALLLPLACPAYLIAYTWTGMLASEGALQQALPLPLPDIRSPAGAGLMLTLVLYPYVYLMTRAAFVSQSAVALEVARTLGAGPWRRFFRVALPLARPAIIAGLALVLMETLADYGTVAYFGVPTLSTGIYRTWFGLGDAMAAAQLAGVLLLAMVVLLTLERRARKERRISVASARAAAPLPLLTASCPGWVQYAERKQGAAVLPHLSRVRSPQQIAGVLVKRLHAAAAGVPPSRVYHVAVAPSFDQKLEATRGAFAHASAGDEATRDVDCVLTPLELV